MGLAMKVAGLTLAGALALSMALFIFAPLAFGLLLAWPVTHVDEESRVRSPDGALDAFVIVHTDAGPDWWAQPCIHIERAGAPPTKGWLFFPTAHEVYCDENLRALKLKWASPGKLQIEARTDSPAEARRPRTVIFDGVRKRNILLEYDLKPFPADPTAAPAAP
jgi:hypothetical protein